MWRAEFLCHTLWTETARYTGALPTRLTRVSKQAYIPPYQGKCYGNNDKCTLYSYDEMLAQFKTHHLDAKKMNDEYADPRCRSYVDCAMACGLADAIVFKPKTLVITRSGKSTTYSLDGMPYALRKSIFSTVQEHPSWKNAFAHERGRFTKFAKL